MSRECPTCRQVVDHRAPSTVELLATIAAALGAVGDRDPYRCVDVISKRVPGSSGRLLLAELAIRVLGTLGDPERSRRLIGEQLQAELELERLDALWRAPAAEGPGP